MLTGRDQTTLHDPVMTARRWVLLAGTVVSLILLYVAVELGGRVRAAMPLALGATVFVVLVWLVGRNGRKAESLGPCGKPATVVAAAITFLATGGIAYTYGGSATLELWAVPEASPFDLRDGANHSLVFELRNVGTGTARFVNWGLSLDMVDANGSRVRSIYRCPVATRGPATDEATEELGPGQARPFEYHLRAEGGQIREACQDWMVASGAEVRIGGIVTLASGLVTLPLVTGIVHSNLVRVLA